MERQRSVPAKTSIKKESQYPSVGYFQLYKYSTKWDKLGIVVGLICTVVGGVSFSFFNLNIGAVTNLIVDYVMKVNSGINATEKRSTDEILMENTYDFILVNISLGIILMLSSYVSIVIFNYTALNQTYKIRKLFLTSVLNQDIEWYDKNHTGDFASRMSDDLKKIEEGIGEKATICLYYLTVVAFCIIEALLVGWELALVSLVALPITLATMSCVSWVSAKHAMREMNAYGKAGEVAEETLSALKTVVAFGGEKVAKDRYDKQLLFACNNNIKRSLFNGISDMVKWIVTYSNYGLSFWYGVHLIVRDRHVPPDEVVYTVGTMISIFFNVYAAFFNFGNLTVYAETFGIAKGAASKIFAIIGSKPVINASKGNGIKFEKVEGKITFRNVDFTYPSRSNVTILKDLDLTINPGETVALVGSSGCGKSTCIQLIQRYYDPNCGTVYIDDHKLQSLDLTWIRSHIGVVGQEPVLFEATIAENIRLGRPDASMDEVKKAAEKANADAFIKLLPCGYDTFVGERGTQLSGGQKQRVAIARALIRKPSILLLDEATSALDTNSEALVQAALDSVSKECTTVIVAHRLSTVKRADRILVMGNGQIQEEGNHDELMDKKGAYYELVTAQLGEEDVNGEEIQLPKQIIPEFEKQASVDEGDKRSSFGAGVAYLKKTAQEEDATSSSLQIIKRFNAPELWMIVFGSAFSFVAGAGVPIFTIMYGKILGVLTNEDDEYLESKTLVYVFSFMVPGAIIGMTSLLQIYYFGICGERLTMRLRSEMFKTFLSQEMAYFDNKNNSVGAVCGILSNEAANVQGATGQRIGNILTSISTVVIALAASAYFEWRITLVALCFAPLIVAAGYLERTMLAKQSEAHFSALQNSTKIAVEGINAIRTVASLGCEDTFLNLYMTELVPYQKIAQCNTHIRGLINALFRSIIIWTYSATFYYGTVLIKDEGINYSAVFTVTMCVVASSWALSKGFAFTPNLQLGLDAAGRIMKILKTVPSITDGSTDVNERWEEGNVRYEKVWFSYPSRPKVKVLRGLDLSVLQGKTVALVGSSGCGKSTVIQLLERFYDPNSGTISVDNKGIVEMNLTALRSQLGIVSQEPNLFSVTIGENIAYGDNCRHVADTEIIEAARKANIHDFIMSLPLGYDTELGEKGTQLSGGQKQRIAIARALVRNPSVLLLDEATSALDAESEKVVQEALDNAKQGRTCIIIAHRLSTIQDADVICVINYGRVVEMGTHQELLALKGVYYDLYSLQH
ncbi:hypothetical protein FQA39_LY07721 [Lamprigera yunnana]|nr:hypothetical protein FQA39_LY07721 [Lamprigera yunnana]